MIKEGIDLPEAMRKQPQFQNMQRLSLDDSFRPRSTRFALPSSVPPYCASMAS